jgi:flagellar biogenesis protein FliO
MFDQMSMPVLFAILISALALVSAGVFVAVRILAERGAPRKPLTTTQNLSQAAELSSAQSTPPREL